MKNLCTSASLFSCLFAVIVMTLSCKGNKGQTTSESTPVSETKDIVSASLDSLHITNMPDSMLHIEYDFQYLKPDGVITDSINASIVQALVSGKRKTDVRQVILDAMLEEESAMHAEIQEFYEPDDETYGLLEYNIVRTGRFHFDAPDTVVAYKATIDMYTGGAHGSYTTLTLNFSRNTGHLIAPEDVFDMTHEADILNLMLAQLLKDNKCQTREELMEKTSLLTLGDLYLTTNFHLGKDAVTFCFGQYDIAPYACGITHIRLDYDTLSPYLKNK